MPGMSQAESSSLPQRTAIAIVGAGLAGVAIAEALGDAAGDAVLLEARELAAGPDPSLGLARAGPAMHFARLVAGHGSTLAAACAAAGRRNRERLEGLQRDMRDLGLRHEVLRLGVENEAEELRRSAAWFRELGTLQETARAEVSSMQPGPLVWAARSTTMPSSMPARWRPAS